MSIKVIYSEEQAARACWYYGEDELAQRVLLVGQRELWQLWRLAGAYLIREDVPPLKGRLVNDKAMAFAVMYLYEGCLRPLRQERRRPENSMPERFRHPRIVSVEESLASDADD